MKYMNIFKKYGVIYSNVEDSYTFEESIIYSRTVKSYIGESTRWGGRNNYTDSIRYS